MILFTQSLNTHILVGLTWNCPQWYFSFWDPFVYTLLLILLEDVVTISGTSVWMKSFLPLHLSPLHPHCEVLLPFSETLRCISQCVSFQLLPPCHFCLFFMKWAPESVLVPAPWESWLCAAVAELVDSSLTSSLKITTACLMVAVGYILFFSAWIQVY